MAGAHRLRKRLRAAIPVVLGLAACSILFLPPSQGPVRAADRDPSGPEHPVAGGGQHRPVAPTDQLPLSPRTAAGQANARPAGGAAPFLTRPYLHSHAVTSVFDHCNPTYVEDGRVCEYDGRVATSSNGRDPAFSLGYAITPGGRDYLYYDGHNGWDLALNYEPVLAAAPGTVRIAGLDAGGFGLTITVDHGNGLTTRYAHLSQLLVGPGQNVGRGEEIAVSGNTGRSTGPHLHFGLYITGTWTAIDPWGWTGSFPDPWPSDSGDYWVGGNPQDPIITPAWSSLGGTLTSGAAAASWAWTRTDVFVRGTDGGLQHKWWDQGQWSGYESLGGGLESGTGPAAVSWGPNRIDVFVDGGDGQLWHKWWNGAAWSGWEPLGGGLASSPAVASWAGGRLDIVVRGTDNALWHRWYDGGRWSAWEPLGGVTASAPAATSWGLGRIDLFVRGTDSGLWHKWWDRTGWSVWEPLGGALTSAPAASSWGPGRIDLVALLASGTPNHLSWATGWSAWSSLGGTGVVDPAVIDRGSGTIDVFVQGTDAALWYSPVPP
jgi:murein DD-endopeptidase MepM/ murein hydrolase activator NlpD